MNTPDSAPPPHADAAPVIPPLTWREKFGYASGDLASCLYFGIFMRFMGYFYTDVLEIAPAAIAGMIFIVRSWDWINDPIMGMVADRTKSRMGRYRPWLIWMLPPWVILGILTFTAFEMSDANKIVYAYITYTLLTMVYTGINVPYSALMGVMTNRSADRTVLASFRFIGAFAGVFIVSSTMLLLVKHLGGGDEKLGYTLAVSIYAGASAVLFLVTFFTCKERVEPPKGQSTKILKDLGAVCKNGPWVTMIAVSILTVISIAVRDGMAVHYFKYVTGRDDWESLVSIFLSLTSVQILGVLCTKHITLFLGGKKKAFITLLLTTAGLNSLFFFIPPSSIGIIYTHQVIAAFLGAPLMPLFWSMIADTADYGAWKLGQRSTGLIFSSGTASQKIGWTIGPALGIYLLGVFEFEANVEQASDTTIFGLRLMMSFIPAGFAVLAAAVVLFYKINSRMEKEMEAAILKSACPDTNQ